ncbi:MAG: hypothetical protein KDD38_04965, partial [Bdellovibrionales bacterium]|nr:hypothetical protein [Bdellovibrionales bacterium]
KSLERIEYLKIREIERKFDDYKTYEAAFKAEKPWPPPEEYKAYLKNKELNNASRNWSDRVPRPSRQTDPNQIVDGDTKDPKK